LDRPKLTAIKGENISIGKLETMGQREYLDKSK